MQYQRAKNVAWRRIGDETVIVNLDRRRMLALNESGAAVWDSLVEVVERPATDSRTGNATEPAENEELAEFLTDLEQEGVLERTDEMPVGPIALLNHGAARMPPAVVWREELHRFGGSCGMLPTQSPLCDAKPTAS